MERASPDPDPSPTLREHPRRILSYFAATPPRLSGYAYFRVVFFACIRLAVAAILLLAGLIMVVAGFMGIVISHDPGIICGGLVWGSLVALLGAFQLQRAFGILTDGRNHNPHY